MKTLNLFLLSIRLFLVILTFALKLLIQLLCPFKTSLFITIIFVAYFCCLVNHIIGVKQPIFKPFKQLPEQKHIKIILNSIPVDSLFQIDPSSISEYQKKLKIILETNPTHRDILTNLALIELDKKNIDGFLNYLLKAKILDPNNKVISKL